MHQAYLNFAKIGLKVKQLSSVTEQLYIFLDLDYSLTYKNVGDCLHLVGIKIEIDCDISAHTDIFCKTCHNICDPNYTFIFIVLWICYM